MPDGDNIQFDVSFDGGKYRLIQETGRGLRCLRGGEEWRDLTGDNMVLVLAAELEEEREKVKKLRAALKPFAIQLHGDCGFRLIAGRDQAELRDVTRIEIKAQDGSGKDIAPPDFMQAVIAMVETK